MKNYVIASVAAAALALIAVFLVMKANPNENQFSGENIPEALSNKVSDPGNNQKLADPRLEKERLETQQKDLEKLWGPRRQSGLLIKVMVGECTIGQYAFKDPKQVKLTNDEWEALMKVFCFLQGEEYLCEQVLEINHPISKQIFDELLADENTKRLLGEDLIKAIRYDTEHEIEYHANTLSKLPSTVLLEKKFDIAEHASGECDSGAD